MSWVGGDIPGLQGMGTKMKTAPQKVTGVVQGLSVDVEKLCSDASWSGESAERMKAKWSGDAANVGSVGVFIGLIGAAVGELGDKLQEVDSALYNAADSCKSRGAQIDMSNGKPLPLTVTGNPNAPAVKKALDAQKEYQTAYDYAIKAAQTFRLETLAKLCSMVEPIVDEKGQDTGYKPDQKLTTATVLRGILTAPLEARNMKIEQLEEQLGQEHQKLEEPLKNAEEQIQKLVSGNDYDIDQVVAAMKGKDSALADFQKIAADKNSEIADLKGQKSWKLTQILNTKLEDLPGISKTLGSLAPELKFLSDVPVLDLAAAAGIAYFQGKEDIEKGGDATSAYSKEGVAAGAGILAAVAVASWGAGPEAGVPVDVAIGAVLVGAGVGEFAHQAFHEHWSEDIHDHGVLGGIWHGVENTGERTGDSIGKTLSNTGDAIEDAGKKAWHATEDKAKSVWHSVFG